MKILVLGSTGQVGYALVRALARTVHHVTVLVRNTAGLKFPDGVTVIQSPEFSADSLAAAMTGIDQVIYSLGPPEQFLFQTRMFDELHCGLLSTFLGALRTSDVRRLTYISTYEVFGAVAGRIAENHPIADAAGMTPYSRSKLQAYRMVQDFAHDNAVQLTTIHPAAVYGGRNTGGGITDFMENLVSWKWYRVPFINHGTFPVIHADSLADLTVKSLDAPGAFLASDAMTTLPSLARAIREQTSSYVPMTMPLPIVKIGVAAMEALAPIVRLKPLIAAGQIDFLTRGLQPVADKAIRELAWEPMSLHDGIARFLNHVPNRMSLTASAGTHRPRPA